MIFVGGLVHLDRSFVEIDVFSLEFGNRIYHACTRIFFANVTIVRYLTSLLLLTNYTTCNSVFKLYKPIKTSNKLEPIVRKIYKISYS
ncbi:hypothetical protein AQUCO_02200298v1 [Aquilegia coerulea]|uniref:Uncharacterized protein n=1 Tax=Aquilegia coerulea TaxID=218851 RepID=A0A2G5DE03_AQUCA|nr:hypothetical protein AQUCO_02200298v1 [Aquilegia coerulea]